MRALKLFLALVAMITAWIGVRSMNRRFIWLLLITVSIPIQKNLAQTPQKTDAQEQTVRLKTDLIEIRVTVADKRGRLINDLGQNDFELLENGRPQKISFFSTVQPQTEQASTGDVAAGPIPSRSTERHARTIVLFIDTLHLSSSSLIRAKQSLRKFVMEQVADNDLATIVASDGASRLAGQFTREKRLMLEVIERLMYWGARDSLFTASLAGRVMRGDPDAMGEAIRIMWKEDGIRAIRHEVRARATLILAEASWRRNSALSMLEASLKQTSEMPGQRILAYISDGFTLAGLGGFTDTEKLNRAIGSATRSGVTIYSLDAKGLDPFPKPDQSELENGINALAGDTGGRAFFNNNDLNQGLQRMLDGHGFHYALGFYPLDDEEKDRQFRRIVVRVKDRPEYVVRAPKGYLPRAEKSLGEESLSPRQRLFREIAAPLPSNNLGVTVWADYLESPADDAQITLQIHIGGGKLEYREERQGQYRVELEIATVIYDLTGKPIQTFTDNLGGDISADKLAQVKQDGFRFARRIALKPGLYQARVGAREAATGQISAGLTLVEAPNLSRKRLTLSSLFSTERKSAGDQAQTNDKSVMLSQVTRRVGQASALVYYFMIYNATAPAGELQMQVEVFRGKEPIYEDKWRPVAARLLGVNQKGIEVASQLMLKDLQPGLYELRVTVKDPRSGQTAQRATMIEVER